MGCFGDNLLGLRENPKRLPCLDGLKGMIPISTLSEGNVNRWNLHSYLFWNFFFNQRTKITVLIKFLVII